jgi:hypothetical protein
MTKLIKRITAPLLSLVFLLNMSSAGMAETTVSAEVGFIFNTLLFLIVVSLSCSWQQVFAMLESGHGNFKKCFSNLCKEHRSLCNCWNYVLASWLQLSLWYSRRWIYWIIHTMVRCKRN